MRNFLNGTWKFCALWALILVVVTVYLSAQPYANAMLMVVSFPLVIVLAAIALPVYVLAQAQRP